MRIALCFKVLKFLSGSHDCKYHFDVTDISSVLQYQLSFPSSQGTLNFSTLLLSGRDLHLVQLKDFGRSDVFQFRATT